MDKWTRIAVVIFVIGLAITLISGYDNRSVVVAHETMPVEDGHVLMGPFEVGYYKWSIWVEDYFPGFDVDDEEPEFEAFYMENPTDTSYSSSMEPTRYVVRDFDGVECEHMQSLEPWVQGDSVVYFGVESRWDLIGEPGDTVEVYLVRSGGIFRVIFAVGFTIMMVGLMFLVFLHWFPKKKARGEGDIIAMA